MNLLFVLGLSTILQQQPKDTVYFGMETHCINASGCFSYSVLWLKKDKFVWERMIDLFGERAHFTYTGSYYFKNDSLFLVPQKTIDSNFVVDQPIPYEKHSDYADAKKFAFSLIRLDTSRDYYFIKKDNRLTVNQSRPQPGTINMRPPREGEKGYLRFLSNYRKKQT